MIRQLAVAARAGGRNLPSLAAHGPGRPRTASSAAAAVDLSSAEAGPSRSPWAATPHRFSSQRFSGAVREDSLPLPIEPPAFPTSTSEKERQQWQKRLGRNAKRADYVRMIPKPVPEPVIPEEPTLIHAALAQHDPPGPGAMLDALYERPHLITPAVVAAIDSYAARLGDDAIRRNIRALLRGERLPIYLPRIKTALNPYWETLEPTVEPIDTFLKAYPPVIKLPETVTPDGFLGHLHALHLKGQPVSIGTALKTLRSLPASKPHHHRGVLHLALAYTTDPTPDALLDTFLFLSRVPLNSKTLRLSVLVLLRNKASTKAPGPTAFGLDMPPHLVPADRQSQLREMRKAIMTLTHRFLHDDPNRSRTPGADVWWLIGEYAIAESDKVLARIAYLRGKERLRLDREAKAAFVASQLRQKTVASGGSATLFPQSEHEHFAATPAPLAQFRHLGQQLARWQKLMHGFAECGWIHRGEYIPAKGYKSSLPRLITRWKWGPAPRKPNPAEDAAAEERHRLKATKKATRRVFTPVWRQWRERVVKKLNRQRKIASPERPERPERSEASRTPRE